jgi:hypothetical protein
MPVVVDTSVFIDLILEYDENRTQKAEKTLMLIQERSLKIVNPIIFKVEIAGVLSRNLPESRVELIVKDILHDVELIHNPDEFAFEIAMRTGSRAVDAYFIATVKLTDSILITNDRVMTNNARKTGVEAYYLVEEFDNAVRRLKTYQPL